MASISADLGRPPLSIPAELHSQGACHTVSSHCSEGVPASLVDDAEHPDSGSCHSSRGEIVLEGSSSCSREKEEQMDTASDQPSEASQDESQVEPLHLAASTAHEPLQASLSVDGVQHKEDGAASHETAPVAAAWDVPSMTPFAGGQPKLNKGSARNRGGVCEGVPRRRSYVRASAAHPTPETEQMRNKLRPKNAKPVTWEKRKYVRKAAVQADVAMGDHQQDVQGVEGESDRLYGCTKCRFLKAGCLSCRHKPNMERDAKIRWRPDKGRPQTAVPLAPTFRPTLEEFRDPIQYIEKIRPEAEKFGIACVVPPEGFNPPFALEKGTNGLNSESFRFTVRKQTTSHLCMREPNAVGGKKTSSRYRSANAPVVAESDNEDVPVDFGFTNLEKPYTLRSFSAYSDWVKSVHYSAMETPQVPISEAPPNRKKKLFQYIGPEPSVEQQEAEFWRIVEDPEEVVESLYGQDLDSGHHGSGFPLPPFRQALLEQHLAQQAAALREKSGHEAVEVSLPPRRFTPEEEEYSLHAWNINNLPRNRGSVLRYIVGDELITGVMVPWLYVGSHMSAFCWHVEDHALYSVNYMHLGAPKVWYGVPAHASEALEEAMNDALPHLFASAPDLLYQLVTLVSPVELQARGVPVCRLVHKEGSFVITFPNAYHAGFNTGFNVAEAVNFGPPDWLRWGSYIVEKYRREGRPATLSMDALLISLVRAAPDVQKREERRKAEDELVVEISALVTGQVKVDIRTRGGTPQTRSMSLEPSGAPTKRSATSKDGKRLTLSTLDPVNMEDVPPAAVRLGAGELGLRIAKERRRQKAGLGSLVHRIPRRRMEGKPGAVDKDGVHINTDDVDCAICKGDLYLTSIVSRECPGVATCPEHASALPANDNSKVLLYRYTLEELAGFVEEAEKCIPGTTEAIEAAFDREANPEPQPVVKHLGPIVHLGDRGPLARRNSEKRPPELELRGSPHKKDRKCKKRSLPSAPPSAAKKPRAPYGSKKAAREAAAAAAAVAAKLAVPSRESRRRMSSMKAQAIIADALAEAEVEITDAALPEPRRRNPRNPGGGAGNQEVKVERHKGADQTGTSTAAPSPPKGQVEVFSTPNPPAIAPIVESTPTKPEQAAAQQVLPNASVPDLAKLANFQAMLAAQFQLAANPGLFPSLMMANEAMLKMMSGQHSGKVPADGSPPLPPIMPPWPLSGVLPPTLSPSSCFGFPGLTGMGQAVANPAASNSSASPRSATQLTPVADGKVGQLPRPFMGTPPVMPIPSASALCGHAHLIASAFPGVFPKLAAGNPAPVAHSVSDSGKEVKEEPKEAEGKEGDKAGEETEGRAVVCTEVKSEGPQITSPSAEAPEEVCKLSSA